MFTPAAFAVVEPVAVARVLLADHAATLVSATADGPVVTVLPLLVVTGDDGSIRLQGHVARKNPHVGAAGAAVATVIGAQGYVSPSWYPSKAEHGKVVPTWDYVVATARGTLVVHDDPSWLLDLVTRLTDRHEAGRPRPWSVDDAPEAFVAVQLRGIVGVEMVVDHLEAKAKLSQNRPADDRAGVVAGLRAGGAGTAALADAVEAAYGT